MTQPLAWACAYATALAVFRRHSRRGRERFALGLWLGVGLAHAGWALLHAPALVHRVPWLLEPGAVSVLFLPLGVLCVAPWRESLASLPLALAVARLGCLPHACCYPSGPAALPELLGLIALHVAVRRRPPCAAWLVPCGFGALRLLCLPLRVPATTTGLDPAWVAVAWVAVGLALRGRLPSAAVAPTIALARPRVDAALRALLPLLALWLLLPLAPLWLAARPPAVLAGSLGALAFLARPLPRGATLGRLRRPGVAVATLAAGLLAALAGAGWAQVRHASGGLPPAAFGALPLPVHTQPLRWLALGVVAPLLEELLYRRRLQDALCGLLGAPLALLGSSALFALAHADPGVRPLALVGGLACGLARRRSGLALSIALHAGWNQGVLLAAGGIA